MVESIFQNQSKVRNELVFNKQAFIKLNEGKKILITGAGTIGESLLRELISTRIKIFVVDNSEITLFNLKEKFKNNDNIKFILCSIRDKKRIKLIVKKNKPNIIIHSAAYKHVALAEDNIYEAIRTNIEGTINLFSISKKYLIEQFVFITTDKAVYPINNMGKTKKIAELYLECYMNSCQPKVKILRFGNIINSSGSLIPIIRNNIKNNKKISVRGENTKRYFVFSDVVAKSILNLLSLNESGTYTIEMGEPINIYSLIKEILMKNNNSCHIEVQDLNNEEKVIEDLLYKNELLISTKHKELFRVKKDSYSSNKKEIKNLLKINMNQDEKKTKLALEEMIFNAKS